MSNLFTMPQSLGLVSFLVGVLAAKLLGYIGFRATDEEVPEHHRKIRSLEASLRVAQKDAEEAGKKLAETQGELETFQASLMDMEQASQSQDEELKDMRKAVKSESVKVNELRRTLTDRAEETIRANVKARDSETELSVLKAGSSAMYDEVDRLENERKELTNRLQVLDKKSFDDDEADPSTQVELQSDSHMSDC
jgi:chromosome segregation ATPase